MVTVYWYEWPIDKTGEFEDVATLNVGGG